MIESELETVIQHSVDLGWKWTEAAIACHKALGKEEFDAAYIRYLAISKEMDALESRRRDLY